MGDGQPLPDGRSEGDPTGPARLGFRGEESRNLSDVYNHKPTHRSNSFMRCVASFTPMDLRQLNALLAVAEHHSFSAAARALHTVQSNVSTHVARLETELGSQLIDRTRGELTAEGEIVADRARRILGELRSIEHDLLSIREEVSGHVRLGVIGTTARWLVAPLLETLAEQHPRIDAVIIEATTTSLLPQLVTERLDAAVVNLPVEDPDVDTRPLFDEERIIVAPADHPLACEDRVTLAQVAAHELEPAGDVRLDLREQGRGLVAAGRAGRRGAARAGGEVVHGAQRHARAGHDQDRLRKGGAGAGGEARRDALQRGAGLREARRAVAQLHDLGARHEELDEAGVRLRVRSGRGGGGTGISSRSSSL